MDSSVTFVLVIAVAVVLLAAAALVWLGAEQVWDRRVALRRRVLVNLLDGSAVDGVLWRRGRRLVVLRDARLLEPGREQVTLDGEVLVERARVAFVQVLNGPGAPIGSGTGSGSGSGG